MKTTAKFFSLLKLRLGVASVEFEVGKELPVRELIDRCCEQLGVDFRPDLLNPDGTVKKGTLLLLEGRNVCHLDGLATLVAPGDTLSVFPPSGGG